MYVLRKLTFAFAVLAFIWLAPAVARADAIVITGGTYFVGPIFVNQATGLTNGVNFSLSAQDISTVPACLSPAASCHTGSPMSPSFSPSALNTVTLTYNGVTYSTAAGASISNLFQFTGPSFTPVPGDPSTWEVPFTFTGQVSILGPTGGLPQFTLTGSGIARFQLEFNQFGFVQGRSATYTFQPQATPEPATLLLFGSGAAALGALTRRRRRRAT